MAPRKPPPEHDYSGPTWNCLRCGKLRWENEQKRRECFTDNEYKDYLEWVKAAEIVSKIWRRK